jgi:hypothetical protein
MPVVRYAESGADGQRAAKGAIAFLDTDDGRVFDKDGNQVGKWTPSDDENTAMLADYAADYSFNMSASAARQANPELAAHMMSARGTGGDDSSVLMDLAPGDVHIPAAMPNFASGYRNFQPMADMFAPPVLVGKQSDKYWQFDKADAFGRAMPTMGTGGGTVGEISPRLANATYSCIERAVGGFVSTQLEANADSPLKITQATTRRCMNVMLLERELRVASLARTSGNWNAALAVTIAAGAQWNGGIASDPIKDLHNIQELGYGDSTGVLMPEPVYNGFVRNPAVRAYYGYKDSSSPIPKPSELQALLNLPPIYVAKMKYINSSGTLSYVWGTDVVLFRQPEEMPPTTQDDVATAYTFRWNAANPKDGVASGGFIVRQYYVQDRGSMGGNKIVVLHNDSEKITSQFIGGLLINAYQ